ncbi:hypothetical protein MRX96_054535 [Rhipicephalus microplus]
MARVTAWLPKRQKKPNEDEEKVNDMTKKKQTLKRPITRTCPLYCRDEQPVMLMGIRLPNRGLAPVELEPQQSAKCRGMTAATLGARRWLYHSRLVNSVPGGKRPFNYSDRSGFARGTKGSLDRRCGTRRS